MCHANDDIYHIATASYLIIHINTNICDTTAAKSLQIAKLS